jgi:hypothetical protein
VFDWQTIGLAIVYRRDYQSEEIDGLVCFTFDHLFSIDIYLYVPSDNTVETVVDESSYVNLFPDELSRISDLSNEELVELLLEYDGCLPNDLPISTWDEQRPLRLGSE